MSAFEKQNNIVAGYGVVDITPPVGEFCSFRLAPNKRSLGVHDNLSVHAFYLNNGKHSLCMISVDTGMMSKPIVKRVKAGITDKTGMPASQILVAATHTHNGAETHGEEPLVDNAIQINRVVEACIKAAETAFDEKSPARIGWGYVELPGFAKNRFQNAKGGDVDRVDNRLDFLKVEAEAGIPVIFRMRSRMRRTATKPIPYHSFPASLHR